MKKQLLSFVILLLLTGTASAQWVLLNDTGGTPDPSAALEIRTTSQGLLPPRMTETEMNAIATPAKGLLIYNTDSAAFFFYNGSGWKDISQSDVIIDKGTGTAGIQAINNEILFVTGNTPVMLLDSNGNLGVGTVVPTAKLDLDGDVGISPSPTDDTLVNGVTSISTVDAATTGVKRALYVKASGSYDFSDASAASTMPCVALAVNDGSGSKKILHYGFISNSSWTWTTGGLIYVSTASGELTQTIPATSGDQVQVVGYAVAPTILFFNPSYVIVTVGP